MNAVTPIDECAHPAATSHASAMSDGAASLAPLPQPGGVGGGQERYTIFSPQARAKFLDHLSINGNVRLACKACGVSSQTAYRALRKSPELAQLWDTALVNARTHAEEVLAERALSGTEEAVFYHGEEVATRVRFDSRLLLAHLARLDRMAERADVTATMPVFDEAIAALEEGEDPSDIVPQDSAPGAPSSWISPREKAAKEQKRLAKEAQEQAELEASWAYDERVRLMERARPEDAPLIEEMNDDPAYDLEVVQLEAFEEGLDEWWTIKDEYELDERLASSSEAVGEQEALEARDLALENGEGSQDKKLETGDVVGEVPMEGDSPQIATR